MDLDAPIITGLRRNRPTATANRYTAATRPLSSVDVHDPTQQLPVNFGSIMTFQFSIFTFCNIDIARQPKSRSPLHLHAAIGHGQDRCLQMLRHGILQRPYRFIQVGSSLQTLNIITFKNA